MTTSLVDLAGVAAVTTAKQWVRLQVKGSTIRAKVWTDGSAEPAAWEISATDSSVTAAGVVQARWARSSSATAAQEVFVDDVTVTNPSAAATVPAAPTALTATATSASAIDLALDGQRDRRDGLRRRAVTERDGHRGEVAPSLPAGTTRTLTAASLRRRSTGTGSRRPTPFGPSNLLERRPVTTQQLPAQGTPRSADEPRRDRPDVVGGRPRRGDNATDETAYVVERSPNGTDSWTVLAGSLARPARRPSTARGRAFDGLLVPGQGHECRRLVGPTEHRDRDDPGVYGNRAGRSVGPAGDGGLVHGDQPGLGRQRDERDGLCRRAVTQRDQLVGGRRGFARGRDDHVLRLGPDGVDGVLVPGQADQRCRFVGVLEHPTATTQAPPPTVPAAPTGLTATAVSASAVDLARFDNATNETGYVLERSPNGTDSCTVVAGSLAASTTTYRDATVAASTAYWYRVKAVNGAGSSGYSNTATVTTPGAGGSLFS